MSKIPKFASNKKCWQNLNKVVFGEELACPTCSNSLAENYLAKYLWCKICRKKYRPTSYQASWLYGMKITPRQLVILLWCWQSKKSTETTTCMTGLSYPTVARWLIRFRARLPDAQTMLSGVVKADESYFSKKRSKQAKYIVTGVTEADTGRKVIKITGDHDNGRRQDVLEQFIQDTVEPGSLVITDKWYAYNELPLLGYYHESHNHSKGDYSNTNDAELIWSVAKRHTRKLYGGRILTRQLPELCNEWMARANLPELFKNPLEFLRFTLVPC